MQCSQYAQCNTVCGVHDVYSAYNMYIVCTWSHGAIYCQIVLYGPCSAICCYIPLPTTTYLCTAVHCYILLYNARYCSTLLSAATYCYILFYTAIYYAMIFPHTAIYDSIQYTYCGLTKYNGVARCCFCRAPLAAMSLSCIYHRNYITQTYAVGIYYIHYVHHVHQTHKGSKSILMDLLPWCVL